MPDRTILPPRRRRVARGSLKQLARGERWPLEWGVFRHRGQTYWIDVADDRQSGYTRVRAVRHLADDRPRPFDPATCPGATLPPDPACYRDQHEALAATRRRIDAWLAATRPEGTRPAQRREVAPAVA